MMRTCNLVYQTGSGSSDTSVRFNLFLYKLSVGIKAFILKQVVLFVIFVFLNSVLGKDNIKPFRCVLESCPE